MWLQCLSPWCGLGRVLREQSAVLNAGPLLACASQHSVALVHPDAVQACSLAVELLGVKGAPGMVTVKDRAERCSCG